MSAACIGGSAAKLVDKRFVQHLGTKDRVRLEDHLVACGWCTERYRRLQLFDRVAAAGPDGIDVPSSFEVDRVAADLGLLADPKPAPTWWRWPAFSGLAMAAALSLLFVVNVPTTPPGEFTARGAIAAPLSFSAFIIEGPNAVRPHDRDLPVPANAHLKLRAAWSDGETRDLDARVRVLMVDADDVARVVSLDPPRTAFDVVSVPGAVSLDKLPPGPATIYVVVGASDPSALTVAGTSRPTVDALKREVSGAIAIERFDLEIAEP